MPLDLTTRATAISAARRGMAMQGIAGQCKVSRQTLFAWREADESFDADLDHAASQWEVEMLGKQDAALSTGDAALVSVISKLLVHRFPSRYSVDPRMRLSAQAAQEGRIEDLASTDRHASTDTSPDIIRRLADKLLEEDA